MAGAGLGYMRVLEYFYDETLGVSVMLHGDLFHEVFAKNTYIQRGDYLIQKL